VTLLLGLDVGTTSVKAVVYQTDGEAVGVASQLTPTHYPRPGWAYYRPEEIWQTVVTVIRGALASVSDPREIAGVAIAAVGEAGVLLDASGQATVDSIAWFDTRTRPQAEWLAERIGKDELFARCGALDIEAVLDVMHGREPKGIVQRRAIEHPEWRRRLDQNRRRFGDG